MHILRHKNFAHVIIARYRILVYVRLKLTCLYLIHNRSHLIPWTIVQGPNTSQWPLWRYTHTVLMLRLLNNAKGGRDLLWWVQKCLFDGAATFSWYLLKFGSRFMVHTTPFVMEFEKIWYNEIKLIFKA